MYLTAAVEVARASEALSALAARHPAPLPDTPQLLCAYGIALAMARLASELGVELHLDTPVAEILTEGRRAVGVRLAGGQVERAEVVVSNAEWGYTQQRLLAGVPEQPGLSAARDPPAVGDRLGDRLDRGAADGLVLDRLGVDAQTVPVHEAQPAEAIIATADKRGCDLIVMASHGRRGLGRLLLGSQTSEVLVGSAVPVLVVRAK